MYIKEDDDKGALLMSRLTKLRQIIEEEQLGALLVTDPLNIRYLAGFTGTAGCVLVTGDDAYFITDFRYHQQAKEQCKGYRVRIHRYGQYNEVNEILAEKEIEHVGIEAENINVATYLMMLEDFDAEIVETYGLVESLRRIKDDKELATIRKACEITDQAYDYILGYIQIGMSENQVANELERKMKELGASGVSFETIVASGWRSALPHGVASDKLIEEGDIVTIDFGCYYNGYASDMTRTFGVGHVDKKLKEIYEVVQTAQAKVIEKAKAGMTGHEVDAIGRNYIEEKGYGQYFGHSLGHGLGLNVHEMPAVSRNATDVLEKNMVITDEPGIYIEGLGGVRIEDDLIVLEDGVEVLTKSPKHLIII